ncbi:hypothetical protein M0802_001907 [Mischocyttarus mexicanus]|nr:hypothetical protein M0802_001907 [Mischocyttarus mexicanus]
MPWCSSVTNSNNNKVDSEAFDDSAVLNVVVLAPTLVTVIVVGLMVIVVLVAFDSLEKAKLLQKLSRAELSSTQLNSTQLN